MVELHVVAVATQVRFLGGALFYIIRVVSSVVRIPAFQAGGPGSIPGRRTISCAISLVAMIPRCQRGGPSSILGWRTFFHSVVINTVFIY